MVAHKGDVMAKPGVKPKYGDEMTERMYMRLSPGQKLSLQSVSSEYTGDGFTELWREYLLLSSAIIMNAENLEELKAQLSERLSSFLIEKGVVEDE
jgi:hypothetical protein